MADALRRQKAFGLLSGLLMGIFLSTTLLSLAGCESLKKKFIRQKKKDADKENEFVPVLQPEEYPEKVKTSAQNYRYHYSLWRVWEKDMKEAIYTKGSDKKQLYLIDQLIVQTEEMKNLLQGDKQMTLLGILGKLNGIRSELQKPAAVRRYSDISRDLNAVGHTMLNDYKFKAVESSLVQE